MTVEPASGVGQGDAGQGDASAQAAAAAAAAEAGSGAGVADDAQAVAQRERDEYIAQVAGRAAAEAVDKAITRLQSASAAPAATPPTASRGAVAELEAEGRAIEQERSRLGEAFRRDGYTGENIVARAELAERTARFVGQVNLHAVQMSEQNRAVDSRGSEAEWQKFAHANPGVDIGILRDAFDKRQERTAAAGTKPKPIVAPPDGARVNVSAPAEVTASERKARTMTSDQIHAHKASLREQGDDAGVAAFDRKLRSGEVIQKG